MRTGSLKRRAGSLKLARETGLEPATSGVTGRRSNQLSYSPASADERERRQIAQALDEVKEVRRRVEAAFDLSA